MPRGPKGEHRPPDVIGNAVKGMRGVFVWIAVAMATQSLSQLTSKAILSNAIKPTKISYSVASTRTWIFGYGRTITTEYHHSSRLRP